MRQVNLFEPSVRVASLRRVFIWLYWVAPRTIEEVATGASVREHTKLRTEIRAARALFTASSPAARD